MAASSARAADGDLSLPSIISDHALLQAGQAIAIWGHAHPGSHVTVQFLDEKGAVPGQFVATADAVGKWSGHLPALPPNTAGHLEITTDAGEKKIVQDVLTGEVWFASGQSNMSYNTAGNPYAPLNPEEVADVAVNCDVARKESAAANPPIRVFQVTGPGSAKPEDDVHGKWVLAAPDNVTMFSAVAWNFGVALENSLHQPIGLIISAVGGTPIEVWMPYDAVAATTAGKAVIARYDKALESYTPEKAKESDAIWNAWVAKYPTRPLQEANSKTRPHRLITPTSGSTPGWFWNGMVHGVVPYTLQGAIWFQADGNQAHPFEYSELVQAMIKSWRAAWNEDFYFYYVEMNNMRDDLQKQPVQFNDLSIIREQQQGALALPKTGVVTAVDLGVKNAHFPNKKPVGERLARLALHEVYGLANGEVYSPQFKSYAVEGNKVRVKFDHADGLRVRGGGEVRGFAISGGDGKWYWASGTIDGTDVVLSSDQVPQPTAVRYAWALFPVISLENSGGLPLRPFRTDTNSPR